MSTISALLPKLSKLSREGQLELAARLRENVARHEPRRQLYRYYPDTGPLRRELYVRHMEFFRAGGVHEPIENWCPEGCDGTPHRERLALCANRIGQTEGIGGYELTLHLTGRYPPWWEGHKLERPIDAWACGKQNETTRDILQRKLLGPVIWSGGQKICAGTGLIPGEDIGDITWKRGIADFIDTARIRNKFGGWSLLAMKSYEQKRGSFEGTEKDIVLCDEEPPLEIYTEIHIRLMTRRGHALLTFTPSEGMSEVVQAFLPGGRLPGEAVA